MELADHGQLPSLPAVLLTPVRSKRGRNTGRACGGRRTCQDAEVVQLIQVRVQATAGGAAKSYASWKEIRRVHNSAAVDVDEGEGSPEEEEVPQGLGVHEDENGGAGVRTGGEEGDGGAAAPARAVAGEQTSDAGVRQMMGRKESVVHVNAGACGARARAAGEDRQIVVVVVVPAAAGAGAAPVRAAASSY